MTIRTKGHRPTFKHSKGGYFVSYNERTVEVINEAGEPETWYEYDQVWIAEKTIESIAVAIIRTRYSENDEFKMGRMSKLSTEWKEYDAFADAAIAKAYEVLNV